MITSFLPNTTTCDDHYYTILTQPPVGTLRNNPIALEQCRMDVKDDIAKYAHVSITDKARCVDRYAERADVQMRICCACGIRDPFDMCDKIAVFNEITCDHWLRVGQDALTR
jgi:hypothetical protein